MWIIFLFIGISLFYLSLNKKKNKKVYLRHTKFNQNNVKIISYQKGLSFKKLDDGLFCIRINKDSPKNIYENIKAFYFLEFCVFAKIRDLTFFNQNPIKLILKYDDKDLCFYLDEEYVSRIIENMNFILDLKEKAINNQDINCLFDKTKIENIKCKNCWFMSRCYRNINI